MLDIEKELSKNIRAIQSSPIRKMFELAKSKKNLIDLSLGQSDIIDPKIVQALQVALHTEQDIYSYDDIAGNYDLRAEIANFYKDAKAENILITAGASGGLFNICAMLLDRGDEVIIFEPYFVAYPNLANFFGAKIKYVKCDEKFQPDLADFKNKISKKTKLIFINSPNNPTGAMYDAKIIAQIITEAKKYGAWIISDEIYGTFENNFKSLWSQNNYEKICVVSGFAKSHGIAGWRLGYMIAPQEIISQSIKIQQLAYVCAPKFAQKIIFQVIKRRKKLYCPEIVKTFQNRQKMIKNFFGGNNQVGAFYSFLKTKKDGAIVVQELLEEGVATVPGIAFAKSKQFHNFIRIAHNVSEEKLKIALEKIKVKIVSRAD